MPLDGFNDQTLSRRAMKAELLDAETELKLAYAWRDEKDEAALHRLIQAYMRLAISMAAKFKRYGAPMNDLIQEAGLGLMKAADKFDPDRGVRFSTYAVWWIKASIQDYVMRNWSMVRTGSTSSQKALFFNMRRVQARLEREAQATGMQLDSHQLRHMIASEIGVPLRDVEMMEGRLSGSDFSLNATQSVEDEGREWIDTLEDDSAHGAEIVENSHDTECLRGWLVKAMGSLNDRERFIVRERKLRDEPRTLESSATSWACRKSGSASSKLRPSARCARRLRRKAEKCNTSSHETCAGPRRPHGRLSNPRGIRRRGFRR
jgi:RNA polymerase sigma-32 factor